MSVIAMGAGNVPSRKRLPAYGVFPLRNNVDMFKIDTARVPTKMIANEFGGNLAHELDVQPAVSTRRAAVSILDFAVPEFIPPTRPNPAGFCELHFGKEALHP